MDREYMLNKISKRLDELEAVYKQIADDTYTKRSAGCMRSRVKRDICILTLLYEVVYACRSIDITNPDALLGLERLVKNV